METSKKNGGLEIDQNIGLQRLNWKLERIGWVFMSVVLIAAALGLFGGAGPFRDCTAGEKERPLSVTYMRFNRLWAPSFIEVYLNAPASGSDTASVAVDRKLLDAFRIDHIVPDPVSAFGTGKEIIYRFAVHTGEPAMIKFHLTANRMGFPSGRIRLIDGPAVLLEPVIYP